MVKHMGSKLGSLSGSSFDQVAVLYLGLNQGTVI